MKTLVLAILGAAAVVAIAQNVIILPYSAAPANDPAVLAGAPGTMPYREVPTSATNAIAPYLWFEPSSWATYKSTNKAAWDAWLTNTWNPQQALVASNANFAIQQSLASNYASLAISYSNLNFVAQNWSSVTNLATAKVAIQAEGEVLLRLKTVLQNIYDGK